MLKEIGSKARMFKPTTPRETIEFARIMYERLSRQKFFQPPIVNDGNAPTMAHYSCTPTSVIEKN